MIKIPKSQGYDIIVWQRKVTSPTWCCGYTKAGEKFLQKIDEDYTLGQAMELKVFPIEFIRAVPRRLRVGGVAPKSKRVHLLSGDPLH